MCVSVSVFVCVNKIPASKVQWPGTDENPLGESFLDVSPLHHHHHPLRLPSFPPGSGVTVRWATRGEEEWRGGGGHRTM